MTKSGEVPLGWWARNRDGILCACMHMSAWKHARNIHGIARVKHAAIAWRPVKPILCPSTVTMLPRSAFMTSTETRERREKEGGRGNTTSDVPRGLLFMRRLCRAIVVSRNMRKQRRTY